MTTQMECLSIYSPETISSEQVLRGADLKIKGFREIAVNN